MTPCIFGDVLVHISLNPDSYLFHIRALGMPNNAVGGLIYIPSSFPQGTFLIIRVDSHLSTNVDIQLWYLMGCVAACLLSLSISVGLCSYYCCVAVCHLRS